MALLNKTLFDENGTKSSTYGLKVKDLICSGTERWSTDPSVWSVCLKILTEVETDLKGEVKKMFERATSRLNKPIADVKEHDAPEKLEAFKVVWRLYVEWAKLNLPAKEERDRSGSRWLLNRASIRLRRGRDRRGPKLQPNARRASSRRAIPPRLKTTFDNMSRARNVRDVGCVTTVACLMTEKAEARHNTALSSRLPPQNRM